MKADPTRFADFLLTVVRYIDGHVPVGARVLDVGCGQGEFSREFDRLGYEAYGADFQRVWEADNDRLRQIETDPYRLPFEDDTFDFVTSVTVLEHVQDVPAFFREVHRILRPGGRALHFYPSTWTPLEKHLWVPLASRIRSKWWFTLWALAGIRSRDQRGWDWRAVARSNYRYSRDGVNYLSRRRMRQLAKQVFGNAYYPESEYVRARLRRFDRLGRLRELLGPLLGKLLFTLNDQLLYTVKR